jgi:LacI family transcriptional regulator
MKRMDRRPTIIDVANTAGVSKSTVSLVLQNSPLVREETRALIRDAMAALGYVYNRSAANLRSANAGLIGLVINDLRNPFFTEFATSLQMALSVRGYATIIANTDEHPRVQATVVGAMIEHGVSAFIISPAYSDTNAAFEATAPFEAIKRAGIPTMQVLRKVDPRTDIFPFAGPDYAAGGRIATGHMLATGAQRVAFVGGLDGRPITQERMAGYLAALAAVDKTPFVVTGRATRSFGHETALRLTKEHPDVDAVLCFNDQVALGMLSGFAVAGRRVGPDVRVVGFDGIEECAEAFPTLSSVDCGITTFGQAIAATVLSWLENQTAPPPETRTPVELIIRDSSGR